MVTFNAHAVDRQRYEADAFQTALEAGKPILVHITAPWCNECRAQKLVVAALAEKPAFKDLTIFDVDFDSQKDALRQLHVLMQSTLVIFRNKTEVGRATGITKPDAIESLVKKAL
jgi:thiol-disulfide isomerase/thioredoxin